MATAVVIMTDAKDITTSIKGLLIPSVFKKNRCKGPNPCSDFVLWKLYKDSLLSEGLATAAVSASMVSTSVMTTAITSTSVAATIGAFDDVELGVDFSHLPIVDTHTFM